MHGDVIPTNVLVGPDGSLTIVDFGFCGQGWRIFDVATFLWDADACQATGDVAEAFVDGYQDVRALADWELAANPLFAAIRSLFRLGNWGPRVDEWGSQALPDDLIKRQLARIRADLARLGGDPA